LTDSIVRRIEQMASSLLLSGSISYLLDDGTTESLVYGAVTPTVPTAKWDAAGDPVADLAAACNTIITASGLLPDVLIMGAGVVSALLSNAKAQAQLNLLHLVAGSIKPSPPTGIGTAQYLGALFRPYLTLYSYAEAFEDDAGALKKMVPDDTCIVGCSNSPATVSYGSISQTEQDGEVRTYADVKFVPRRLSTPREDKVELRIASRPALVPFDLSGWVVIKPLGGTLDPRRARNQKGKEIINHASIYIIYRSRERDHRRGADASRYLQRQPHGQPRHIESWDLDRRGGRQDGDRSQRPRATGI
jgi:hypothetical protein